VFLWLAVTTGARRGELVALRWSDLDLDRGVLRLATNYVVRSGQRQLKGTKTGEERLLSLDTASVSLLMDLHAARSAALVTAALSLPADAFVLTPDPLGARPWNPDHFTHAYRSLADDLGIVEPLKNLRHFNATQLLAAGVDLRTTAGRLGHSDGGATTLRVYASWTQPADRRAVDQLAGNLTELRAQSAAAPAAPSVPAPRRRMARVRRTLDEVLPASRPLRDYRQLAEALRDAIRSERLRPGDPCPSAASLGTHTGLAGSTAQRAITLLGEEGTIVTVRGRWEVAGPVLQVRDLAVPS
jgi:integrase